MRVILFGTTGMVGQGVLRECLLDPRVEKVLSIGRSKTGQRHPKFEEAEMRDLDSLDLTAYDACFFCLGVSSAGMSEDDYRRVTYDMTLDVAKKIATPKMTFIYVSGAGTDSTERGRTMWARVKGATENALLKLPFKAAYMFRPGVIQPLHGVRSRTTSYRVLYAITRPLLPVLKRMLPKYVTTTEQVGRAMINAAANGAPKAILESEDISRHGRPR
jgi:uncharacterized protein YbjT (DUF2867 family)